MLNLQAEKTQELQNTTYLEKEKGYFHAKENASENNNFKDTRFEIHELVAAV